MPNPTTSYAGQRVIGAVAPEVLGRIKRLGMSPRQQRLNTLWAHYRTVQHDTCKVDWDGGPVLTGVDRESVVSSATFIPPGFYDAGGSTMPLRLRRPTAPYHLAKLIPDRFTGLLFSERHHPAFRVEDDPDAEERVAKLVEASRLWPQMWLARMYGGAMGSVAMGFQFVRGKPIVEVHDPRWALPTFSDYTTLTVSRLEIRYMRPIEEQDPKTGEWVEVPYWYRRVIDEARDVIYKLVPVAEGDEPDWENFIQHEETHELGYCPVVWIQNTQAQDDVDGDPDCHGLYDSFDAIDRLYAQAHRGTLKNADPTVHMATDLKMAEVVKGSDNALKTERGGAAGYMEMTGSGVKTALEVAKELRANALEVAQCVIEHPDQADKTATEVNRRYESMLARADVFREQYGERGVKTLVSMMIDAARKIGTRTVKTDDGGIGRLAVILPGESKPFELSEDMGELQLKWPPYFAPTVADAVAAADAAGKALQGGVVDQQHASQYVAPFFNVEDVPGMIQNIKAEVQQRQAEMEQAMMERMKTEGGG